MNILLQMCRYPVNIQTPDIQSSILYSVPHKNAKVVRCFSNKFLIISWLKLKLTAK